MASLDNFFRRWMERSGTDAPNAETALVIGLGRFGTAVAETLTSLDVEVMAIDTDPHLVDKWVERLDHVRVADATDAATLTQLGVTDFDAVVVAIGNDLEASILTTAALVDLGVKNVWAKAITEEHGRILERVGARHVVHPEREMGERVAHVVTGEVSNYYPLDGGYVLAELRVPADFAGRTLAETGVRSRFGVTVVSIKPHGRKFTYATMETKLGSRDVLLIAGDIDDVERFSEYASR